MNTITLVEEIVKTARSMRDVSNEVKWGRLMIAKRHLLIELRPSMTPEVETAVDDLFAEIWKVITADE